MTHLLTADKGFYPRVCGGTVNASMQTHCGGINRAGLSPRVRGTCDLNPLSNCINDSCRSIPACAGEPYMLGRVMASLATRLRSIPACAGEPSDTAIPSLCVPSPFQGLSPRVRGNPCREMDARRRSRRQWSIPACAGEPFVTILYQIERHRVYPRVCGEPLPVLSLRSHRSHLARVYPRVCGGTPDAASWSSQLCTGVYPRVCGGTCCR